MAKTAPLLWVDGAMKNAADVTIPLMGHAPQRGSLVFDVGSFHASGSGVSLFRAREHVARFLRSCAIVGLAVAPSWDEEALVIAASDVVAACGARDGLVRWSAYFVAEEPDLLPREATARVAVAAQLLQDAQRTKPIRVATFDDARKAPPEALPPEAKAASAYLGPMIARRRAVAEGADDVVLLDVDGNIAEAPIANAFAVIGGVLHTPPLGRVLPGITRDAVLTIARDGGIEVREAPLPRSAFAAADEAFLTSTSMPLHAIGRIDDRVLPDAPGPITARILERLLDAQHARAPEYAAWSRPVPSVVKP